LKKIKLFIISESWDGCYYYRVEVFKRYSKIFDVRTNIDYKTGKIKDPYICLDDIFDSEIIVFLRPTRIEYFVLLKILKSYGKIVIFSSDDSFSTIDSKNPAKNLKKNLHINEEFLKNSDVAIVSTEFLKNEYKTKNINIYIVPNLIDFEEYKSLYQANNNQNLRIGLIGSVQTAENAGKFLKTLKDIYNKYHNITFVFFGSDDVKMTNFIIKELKSRCEFVRSVPIMEYAKKLADLRIDIALIPRKDNFFNRCKSNCKYQELSALKIATIAQGFADGKSPYQNCIENNVNGYIVMRDSDWEKYLTILIKDRDLLNKIKENAYKYVSKNFNVKKNIDAWDQTYLKILENYVNNLKPTNNDLELTKRSLETLSNIMKKDTVIKNKNKEILFLNNEIIRIRNTPIYKTARKIKGVLKK
jgi:glycosyltransferase involved in cell wall biosynthesis